jgi:hypothetical protein
MRQKRAKTYKRVMALYTQTFGFRTPFQILGKFDNGAWRSRDAIPRTVPRVAEVSHWLEGAMEMCGE